VDVNQIDVESLERFLAAGAPLIDVRQPDEYARVHVPGARLMPLDELPELIDEIPMEVPVYLICQSGGRSHRAAEWLVAQGFDASNVAGGTVAWVDAGKPTATGTDPG
jgi:rhodanese-related sulfurtransferase